MNTKADYNLSSYLSIKMPLSTKALNSSILYAMKGDQKVLTLLRTMLAYFL